MFILFSNIALDQELPSFLNDKEYMPNTINAIVIKMK